MGIVVYLWVYELVFRIPSVGPKTREILVFHHLKRKIKLDIGHLGYIMMIVC